MDLKERYEASVKQRPEEARGIPKQKVDYFDRQHEVSRGFIPGKKKGDPTDYKEKVIRSKYEKLVEDYTPPESYNPEDPSHRYDPKNKYGDPGRPQD